MVESVLDRLGEEVTGIVSPVSLCMALTVGLVRLLNPTGDAAGRSVSIASAYYKEQVHARPAQPRCTWGSPADLPSNQTNKTFLLLLAQGDDSTSDKITGSIINAVIFVGIIALMTFVLVLLFKYGVCVPMTVSAMRYPAFSFECFATTDHVLSCSVPTSYMATWHLPASAYFSCWWASSCCSCWSSFRFRLMPSPSASCCTIFR